MEQLRDALEKFGWTNYEAACYAALVRFGEMKASRVATETGILKSKVYEPLNQLTEDGYVRLIDDNPNVYAAQNPQYVIEHEQRQFTEESQEVLEKLQEAWEVQEELRSDTDYAWVVKGRDGTSMELSQILYEADESIEAFDNRLARAARDVIEKLEEQADNGIDLRLVSGSQARDRLELLQRAGAEVRELTELTRSAYYIIDGEQVLMNLSSGDATVVVQDTDIATIIRNDFEETFTEASEVPDND
jgi:sugar-specific transcriptional regulator TrmB